MKFSIITPSFNQGAYIEQCILSVKNQKGVEVEHIIIDGGSTDNTRQILTKYQSDLAYYICESDDGQSEAINKGLQRATGDIINWLNADDFYTENALLNVLDLFKKKYTTMCVIGLCRVFYENNPQKKSYITRGTDYYPDNLPKTIGIARTDQPSTFYHKEAIRRMGQVDERLHYIMDRDWWIKYIYHFGIQRQCIQQTNEVLVHFRLHNASKTIQDAQKFQVERDAYYHSLAISNNNHNISNFLVQNEKFDANYHVQNFDFSHEMFVRYTKMALVYYIFARITEFYAARNFEKFHVYLDFFEKQNDFWDMLAEKDRKTLKKLKFRANKYPMFLIKWWDWVQSLSFKV